MCCQAKHAKIFDKVKNILVTRLYLQLVANNVHGFNLFLYCISQGWGSKITFWTFYKNMWFQCDLFTLVQNVLWLVTQFWNIEDCLPPIHNPTHRSFSTSPNMFACYAWWPILILDEKKQLEWASGISSNQREAHGPIFSGTPSSAFGALAAPECPLLFAGEHTGTENYGTVGAAYVTGLRAAGTWFRQKFRPKRALGRSMKTTYYQTKARWCRVSGSLGTLWRSKWRSWVRLVRAFQVSSSKKKTLPPLYQDGFFEGCLWSLGQNFITIIFQFIQVLEVYSLKMFFEDRIQKVISRCQARRICGMVKDSGVCTVPQMQNWG